MYFLEGYTQTHTHTHTHHHTHRQQLLILCSSKVLLSIKLYFSNTISLVSSGSCRLSYANGIDATHSEEVYTTCTAISDTYISAVRTFFVGDEGVSIAQLVEMTHTAVLGRGVEVAS